MAAPLEIDCPTCNGHGELVGDDSIRGERIDAVAVCPECEGDRTVRVRCRGCGTDRQIDRIGYGWSCEDCHVRDMRARAERVRDYDLIRQWRADDRRDEKAGRL